MTVNSKQKGKRGELAACKYLHSLGFLDAKRTAQYKGNDLAGDIECLKSLPYIHFEVKVGEKVRIGTKAMDEACLQSIEDSEEEGKPRTKIPCVLWKQDNARQWCATFPSPSVKYPDGEKYCRVTLDQDFDISSFLEDTNSMMGDTAIEIKTFQIGE